MKLATFWRHPGGRVTNVSRVSSGVRRTSAGAVSYAYDSRGNQTQAGTRTFTWTLANRLASTTDAGTTSTYTYDGDGTRLQSTRGGQITNFRWDTNFAVPQLALERDGANNVLRSYLHAHEPLAMQSEPDRVSRVAPDLRDRLGSPDPAALLLSELTRILDWFWTDLSRSSVTEHDQRW